MKKLIYSIPVIILLTLGLVQVTTFAQDPAESEPAEPVTCETDYIVQAGDWLSTIAADTYDDVLTYPAIAVATNAQAVITDTYATVADSGVIEADWKLCLPSADDIALIMASDEISPFITPPSTVADEDETASETDTTDTTDASATTETADDTSSDTETATDDTTATDTEAATDDAAATDTETETADAIPDLSLAGQVWALTVYGSQTSRQAVAPTTAGFFPEGNGTSGRLSGSTGCNAFFTTFSINGDAMTVGPTSSTRILCSVPSGVMAQEREFLAALQTVEGYRITGNQLEIIYDNGAGILTFAAQ